MTTTERSPTGDGLEQAPERPGGLVRRSGAIHPFEGTGHEALDERGVLTLDREEGSDAARSTWARISPSAE